MTDLPMDKLREDVARITDPSAWRVMDGYLADMLRKYRGENVGYDPEAFKHKQSLAKADQIIALFAPLQAERDEALRQMSHYAREAGEAKGQLEMSEAAGIVEDWREKCEGLQAKLTNAQTWNDHACKRISTLEARASALREALELSRDRIRAWEGDAFSDPLMDVISQALAAVSVEGDEPAP